MTTLPFAVRLDVLDATGFAGDLVTTLLFLVADFAGVALATFPLTFVAEVFAADDLGAATFFAGADFAGATLALDLTTAVFTFFAVADFEDVPLADFAFTALVVALADEALAADLGAVAFFLAGADFAVFATGAFALLLTTAVFTFVDAAFDGALLADFAFAVLVVAFAVGALAADLGAAGFFFAGAGFAGARLVTFALAVRLEVLETVAALDDARFSPPWRPPAEPTAGDLAAVPAALRPSRIRFTADFTLVRILLMTPSI